MYSITYSMTDYTNCDIIVEKDKLAFIEEFNIMDGVNKTLYIPLYGKSYVSKKGIILKDEKAEEIWEKEQFKLKGKSKSKWLAYYMGIRGSVFDKWLEEQMIINQEAVVIHIGCGMDSRVHRVGTNNHNWYDVDFPEVITERKKYYIEDEYYKMVDGDARELDWLTRIPFSKHAIVVLEGISMYLNNSELKVLLSNISNHFESVNLLMDCYSIFAAKISKYKNPINDVGVTKVFGLDNPETVATNSFLFKMEHVMIPAKYVEELHGLEKFIFKKLYAGNFSKKLYKLFEFEKPMNKN